ncbi:MAG: hypothetical protein SAK29_28405 [Scytonema sp. PMC 1069.18]|nr:hypothetical protein [Scytonema sp. PMC 1069.18]MEC4887677.1 hypothetical protein [Scytonema sp. PMC 1070.18]
MMLLVNSQWVTYHRPPRKWHLDTSPSKGLNWRGRFSSEKWNQWKRSHPRSTAASGSLLLGEVETVETVETVL